MFRLLLILFIAASVTTFAQPQWQWAKKSGSANYTINPSYPHQAIAAVGGKSLWAAMQNKKAIYGQLAFGDYLMQELDAAGNITASLAAGGRFSLIDAQADAAGNWYLLGTFYDTVRLSSSLQFGRDSFGNAASYFIARLHAGTLAPEWMNLIGTNSVCEARAFSVSGNSIYVPMDSLVKTTYLKYDAATGARTVLWTQAGRSNTSFIQADAAGNIYVAGSCAINGPLTFNGTASTIPATMQYPWYIARYHANGQHHWHQYLNDITCNSRSFKLAGNNALYLSGMLADSATLGSHHFIKPQTLFNSDYLLARLDSNGGLVWAQQRQLTGSQQGNIFFSTQYQTAVADTMLYLLCETSGLSYWGNAVNNTTPGNRHLTTLVAFGSSTGSAQWIKMIGGLYTIGQHIISDGSSIWITGNGSDSTSLKFDTVMVPTIPGQYVPYIAKMKVGNGSSSTGVNVIPLQAPRFYPNPAQGFVMITDLHGGETVTLQDLTGKTILRQMSSKNSLRMETASLPRGFYFLEISAGGGRQVLRLVLE